MTILTGVLEGMNEADPCRCGHPAVDHTPCCGACLKCGNKLCAEFRLGL